MIILDLSSNEHCSNVPSFFAVFQLQFLFASFFHWRNSCASFQMHRLYSVPVPQLRHFHHGKFCPIEIFVSRLSLLWWFGGFKITLWASERAWEGQLLLSNIWFLVHIFFVIFCAGCQGRRHREGGGLGELEDQEDRGFWTSRKKNSHMTSPSSSGLPSIWVPLLHGLAERRHEICQKFYTARFSGQRFYTFNFTEFQQL